MPQVPGLVPTVQPSGAAPGIDLPVPVDAFGGAVGHALEGFGNQIEKSSDQIWQRAVDMQNLNNETSAKEADAQYLMKAGVMNEQFKQLEGQNAGPEALAKHIQELQDLRTSLRSGLNPAAARMYDGSSLANMGSYVRLASGYSGTQVKVAANNASSSRVDLAQINMGQNPTDELTVQRNKRVIESEVDRQADINGWSDEQRQATKQIQVSKGFAHRINGVAEQDALGAQSMLNNAIKNKAINDTDAEKLQYTIDRKINEQGSRSIADKVLSGYRAGEDNRTEQQFIDQAVGEVGKVKGLTDDQRQALEDRTRTAISIGYRGQKSVQVDQQRTDFQTVTRALNTPNAEGRLPTTIDQLKLVDPEVAPAMDRLKPTEQNALGKHLLANAMGKTVEPTDHNQARYKELVGMSTQDKNQFLATNLADEVMPRFQIQDLLARQRQLTKQTSTDPRVQRALGFLRPDLVAAGIDPRGGEDKRKDYYQFVGGLQDQLDQFTKDHPGKLPSSDDVRKIGAQLMQEQATGRRGWLYFTDEKTPEYQLPVPDDEAARLRADPYWRSNNITPNDDMIARIYRAQRFKELYGGAASRPAQAQFPPNAPK